MALGGQPALRDLEDLPVSHSAGAFGFASSAAEARIEVRAGVRTPGKLPFHRGSDQTDSTARRLRFCAGQLEGWACG